MLIVGQNNTRQTTIPAAKVFNIHPHAGVDGWRTPTAAGRLPPTPEEGRQYQDGSLRRNPSARREPTRRPPRMPPSRPAARQGLTRMPPRMPPSRPAARREPTRIAPTKPARRRVAPAPAVRSERGPDSKPNGAGTTKPRDGRLKSQ